jgi:hypothetical protein
MKAIIRTAAGLLSLLLFSGVSQARIWISPVYKTPLPCAPSPSNSGGFFLVNERGCLTGPHYYLVPPFPPFNGILPGPTGHAIQQGNLPHTLLLSHQGMAVGNVPYLGQQHAQGGPPNSSAPPPNPFATGPMPYAMAGGRYQMPPPNVQVPYGNIPMSPYPMQGPYPQAPYPQPMPMPQPRMPYAGAMPYAAPGPVPYQPANYGGPMLPARPIAYLPCYGPPGMYATARQDPRTGIWQVQGVMPSQGPPTSFMPIPSFKIGTPGPQDTQRMPMTPPVMDGKPGNGIQFGPIQQFDPFGRMQGPQPPQMNWEPMQLPRMEMGPPPPPPGMCYPTHPFTRSPRDFFMWGENMDDERARRNRPFPVP